VIVWFTDEPAKSQVDVNGETFTSNTLTKKHSVQVTGLSAGGVYTASAKSVDASGNESLLNEVDFTTLLEVDSTLPVFTTAPVFSQVGATIAIVDFATDEPVTALVEVKQGDTVVSSEAVSDLLTTHQIQLPSLSPLSTYQVVVSVTDANNNGPVMSSPLSLVTKENTDRQAPRYSTHPVVRNITNNSATLYWQTDEPAISAISYNLKSGGNHIPLRSEDFTRTHVQTLTGLEPNKEYEFIVSVTDAFDNGPRLSRKQSFFTRVQTDVDAPLLLSDIGITQLGDTSATLVWSTDESASGVIRFGETSEALTEQFVISEPSISQRAVLSNLKVDTTYFYELVLSDSSGNSTTAETQSFTTQSVGSSAPLAYVDLPSLLQVKGSSMTVGLRTNKAAHGEVLCFADDGEVYDARSVVEAKHQQLIVTGLTPGHYYQCQVSSTASTGGQVGGTLGGDTFATGFVRTLDAVDTTNPALVGSPVVSYISDTVALVEWTTNELSQSVVNVKETSLATYQVASTKGKRLKHSQVIKRLKANTAYHYRLILQDEAGNTLKTGNYSFTTSAESDALLPEFSIAPSIVSVSKGQVQLTFTASEPVTAKVSYTKAGSNRKYRQADDNEHRLTHTMNLNFTPNKDYQVTVHLRDLAGNSVSSDAIALLLKTDSDGDGLTDIFEATYGVDGGDLTADGDEDGDGVTNLEEQTLGLDPTNADSDGDGVNDGDDSFPNNPGEQEDTDNDGVGDNSDNLNNQLSKVYSFDEMLPRLPSDIYFNNVVGMGADHKGRIYIVEQHGSDDVRFNGYNASENGRLIKMIKLGQRVGGWQKVVAVQYHNKRWHIVAYHSTSTGDGWYWHQLASNGRYIKAIKLDGVSSGGSESVSAVADVQITDEGLSALTLIDGAVNVRYLDEKGTLSNTFNLIDVNVQTNLHFAQNGQGTMSVIGADSGDCGTLWVYNDLALDATSTYSVGDYQQNSCGVLQGIQLTADDNIVIDAQTELYQIDNSGGIVHRTITNQTGSDARFMSSVKGRHYLAGNGLLRKFDKQLAQVANYSAFSANNASFIDDNFTVHGDNIAVDTNQVWTVESSTARVQLFDFESQADTRFKRSFTLKDNDNRLIASQDMAMGKETASNDAKLFVLENTDTQVLLHRFTLQGGWGGAIALPSGFARALHYQGDFLYILNRDTTADTTDSVYRVWQFDVNTNAVIETWDLAAVTEKGLDITGDGSELFVLHEGIADSEHLAILRLGSDGSQLGDVALNRLSATSDVADKARMSFGEQRLALSYGPEVHLYQTDTDFTFAQVFDETGYGQAQNAKNSNVTAEFTAQGKLVWADTAHGRLQVVKPTLIDVNAKAIIIAGGGDYVGNNLWDATLQHANTAYRTLIRQGFTKDSIYYLSNATIDFDGNGIDDELFLPASKANLQTAIDWSGDADSLVFYMVDHGNVDNFRVQSDEVMSSNELGSWLNSYSGRLSLVYDACKSGSFIDELEGENRTIITSANSTQDALFLQDGAISFSGLFWQHIDNGQDMYGAFTQSSSFFSNNALNQTPMLSVSSVSDTTALKGRYIGQGNKHASTSLSIQSSTSVVEGDELTISANLAANGRDDLQRIWAFVVPKGAATSDGQTSPIIDAPTVDLTLNADGVYTGKLSAGTLQGSQYVSVVAQDSKGNKTLPSLRSVSMGSGVDKRAILIAAYKNGYQVERINPEIERAYNALIKQGYSAGQIKVLAEGVSQADDVATSLAVDTAINTWAKETTGDLFVYIAGDMDANNIRLKGDNIAPSSLVAWLDGTMVAREGQLTVLLDGDASGGFAAKLSGFKTPANIIASTSAAQKAHWLASEYISFSNLFFTQVAQGQTTRESYRLALIPLKNAPLTQTPYLDVNNDGVSHKKIDAGLLLRSGHVIGGGLLTAGDEPLIAEIAPAQTLSDGNSAELWAQGITSTGALTEVYAYIAHPASAGSDVYIDKLILSDDGSGRYSGIYDGFIVQGDYLIQYVAKNSEGYISLLTDDVQSSVSQSQTLPDSYEVDNSPEQANVIVIDSDIPELHSLHEESDEDWGVFYSGGTDEKPSVFSVAIDNVANELDVQVEIYKEDGVTRVGSIVDDGVAGENELVELSLTEPGLYYVRILKSADAVFTLGSYQLSVSSPLAGFNGTITGQVTDLLTGKALSRVKILTDRNIGALSRRTGAFLFSHFSGEVVVTFSLEGYDDLVETITVEELLETQMSPKMGIANTAPEFTSTALTQAAEDTQYSYTFTATDADSDDNLTYSVPSKPSWLSLSGNTLSGVPSQADVGDHAVVITVNDGSETISQSYTITVENTNDAPVFTSTIVTQATEDTQYSYTFTATDVDGDDLTYNVTTKPGWLSLSGNTLSGIPVQADVGNHEVVITASDNAVTTSQSFTITVENVNDAPVFTSTAQTQATEGQLYSYVLTASDVDGDTLSYSASSLPSWLSLTGNTLSGTPSDSDVGSVEVTVTVSDNSASDSQTFTIDVIDNGATALSIVAPDDIIMEANSFTTSVNLGDAIIVDDNDINLQASIDNPGPYAVGEHTVTWTVTDSDNNTATDTQQVTITDTTAPDLGQPSEVIVNSVGYYSDLSKLITLNGVDLVEGEIAASIESAHSLLPGRHEVLWKVSDSRNNSAQVNQSVVILPQASLGGSYLAEISASVSIPVTLNAKAADYPVLLNIDIFGKSANGERVSLPAQDVVINEGQRGSVEVNLIDIAFDDSVELTLVSASNATLGAVTTAHVNLVSNNIAPRLMLQSSQSDEVRTSLFKDQGNVIIDADIIDVNLSDTHTITWDSALSNTSNVETTFSFDPSLVDEGNYTVTATVTETNTADAFSVSLEMNLDVLLATPTLDANQDSDGDGINDELEGLGDSDGDGIADFVDNNTDISQLPIGEGNERLQTSTGITLSLGHYVRQGLGIEADTASIDPIDFVALVDNDNAQLDVTPVSPVIDFVIGGITQTDNTATVIIPLPTDISLPPNAQYLKYQVATGWTVFVDEGENTIASAPLTNEGQCPAIGSTAYQSGLIEGASCIELTLVDGGVYDDDGLVNGQISDPAVISANFAPTLSIDEVSTINEQTQVLLTANAVDPEGATLTYLWQQTGGETVVLTGENEASVSFTAPDITSDSNLSFSVTVSDGLNEVVQETSVMVVWVPQDLSIAVTTNTTSVNEGSQASLNGSSSIDPDGYNLSYQWAQVSGPTVTLTTPTNASTGFTAPQVTSDTIIVIRLIISQGSRTALMDTSITVKNVATTPTTPPKSSGGGGGGAVGLYWLMVLLLISLGRVKRMRYSQR
jgi:hypothetical protein